MASEIITTLIGVGGTSLGVFVTSLFNYLSKKSEHTAFIKRFRAERAFDAAERLLAHILSAEYADFVDIAGEKRYINQMLSHKKVFVAWYAEFVETWYPKQYLLDPESLDACKKLHTYLYKLSGEHVELIEETSPKTLSLEDLSKSSEELRPLLYQAHESLQAFLQHKIENA